MAAPITASGVLIAILGVGCAIRLIVADRIALHIDEPASILAGRMVAEHGIPTLPSGVLYLQGTPLSYALAPLVWLGLDGPDRLALLRLPAVAAGTVAIYAAYRIGAVVAASPVVGLLVAVLVAIDPLSVRWSGHVRMYAPFQALTLLLLWCVVLCIRDAAARRPARWLPPLAWAAVLTHPAAALVLLPAVLGIVGAHGRRLLGPDRLMGGATALAAAAPIGLLAINRLADLAGQPVAASSGPFVGAHYVDLGRVWAWNAPDWRLLYPPEQGGGLAELMPAVVVALSAYLLGWSIVALWRRRRGPAAVALTLLASYWFPLMVVSNASVAYQARYFVNVQVLPCIFLAVPLGDALRATVSGAAGARARRTAVAVAPGLAAATAGAIFLAATSVSGLSWLNDHPAEGPDYATAYRYVEANRAPGELLVVSLPPVADFALAATTDVMFLAGPEGGTRVAWYVVADDDGRPVDYWLGVPAIGSTQALCDLLDTHPDLWLVVDESRLGSDWAYQGDMGSVILGLTYGEFRSPGGALVRRVAPAEDQIPNARARC